MASEVENSSCNCAHCGERRPKSQFYQFQDGTLCCASCLVRRDCENCGTTVILIEKYQKQNEIYCESCQGSSEGGSVSEKVISIIQRGSIAIAGILLFITLRIGDELVRILLRSLDGVLKVLSFISEQFVFLRPVLIPVSSLYQSLISTDVILPLLLVALLIIFVDSLFPGGVRLFHVATFPGTIIHEWGHKKTCERYDIEVTNVVYFQLANPLGVVEFRGPCTFWQTIVISTAPLLFNTVVSLGIAIVGTIYATRVGHWGLALVYWLAFSVGAHAFPSHGDIDNIWKPILNHWRADMKRLLAVPIVLLLRSMQILKLAYLEAIYGAMIVLSGISIGHILL